MAGCDQEAVEVIQLLGIFILRQILQQDNGGSGFGIWECYAEEKKFVSNDNYIVNFPQNCFFFFF